MLFNALQEACQSLPIAVKFFEALVALCAFLGDRDQRRKYQASCQNSTKFDHFAAHHIDWRWEFMVKAIDAVIFLWADLQEHFDLEKMLHSESGTLHSQTLTKVKDVLKTAWWFPVVAELFKTIAAIIERYAHKLEGCYCHAHIWMKKRKFALRVKEVQQETGIAGCVWKGRMLAWWIAVGIEEFLESLRNAMSTELETLFQGLDAAKRGEMVALYEQLMARTVEILKDKLSFFHHIPWKLIAISGLRKVDQCQTRRNAR